AMSSAPCPILPRTRGRKQPSVSVRGLEARNFVWGILVLQMILWLGSPLFAASVTGGFVVDVSSREQVRAFYNAVYSASEGVPMDTTADVTNCIPGTNSIAFSDA